MAQVMHPDRRQTGKLSHSFDFAQKILHFKIEQTVRWNGFVQGVIIGHCFFIEKFRNIDAAFTGICLGSQEILRPPDLFQVLIDV